MKKGVSGFYFLLATMLVLAGLAQLAPTCGDDDDNDDNDNNDDQADDDNADDDTGGGLDCEALLNALNGCQIWFGDETWEEVLAACQGVDQEFFMCIATVYQQASSCDAWYALINSECSEQGDDDTTTGDCDLNLCPEGWPSQPACTDTTAASGLTWTMCDNGAEITHYCAVCYVENLNLASATDWRLPTLAELESLYNSAASKETECGQNVHIVDPFDLSCTTMWAAEYDAGANTAAAYNFSLGAGSDEFERYNSFAFRVLAVH